VACTRNLIFFFDIKRSPSSSSHLRHLHMLSLLNSRKEYNEPVTRPSADRCPRGLPSVIERQPLPFDEFLFCNCLQLIDKKNCFLNYLVLKAMNLHYTGLCMFPNTCTKNKSVRWLLWISKKNKKCWGATARGVPKRSPIQVLTAPDVA
jgi:hypothetical protein